MWQSAFLASALAAALIFVLPLFIPLKQLPIVSASYLAGFNNSVAVIAAVGLSLVFFALTWWAQRTPVPAALAGEPEQRLSTRLVAGVVIVYAVLLSAFCYLVALSHDRYLRDAGYIIEQATVRRDTGRALYTQIEFAYGPLLLQPVIWLSHLLHGSITAAYYMTFVAEACLGLLLLAYVLNELPIRGNLRKPAFFLLALGAITPHLGLNYTLFRFVSPFAVLLFATRSRSPWRCAALLAAGEILELLISPELGLAMAAGVLTFGLMRTWQGGRSWLATALLPLLALALLLLALGHSYLGSAASFSRGALNLPVGPYPHLLVLLFALVWLVPAGLGWRVARGDPQSSRLLAFYVTALAFMPAAMGRCDPLHVFFNGVGIWALSLVAVSASSPKPRRAWLASLAVLVLWNHFVNERLFEYRTVWVFRQTAMPYLPKPLQKALIATVAFRNSGAGDILAHSIDPEVHLNTAELGRIVGDGAVATPLEISPLVEAQLAQTKHHCPAYYAFWVNMVDPLAEQRSIQEADRCGWMLLPAHWVVREVQRPGDLYMFQGLRLPYRERHPVPYLAGAAFTSEVKQHWTAVQKFGPYLLYEHKDPDSSVPVATVTQK